MATCIKMKPPLRSMKCIQLRFWIIVTILCFFCKKCSCNFMDDLGVDEITKKVWTYFFTLTLGKEHYNENSPPPHVFHLPEDTEYKNGYETAKYNPWVTLVMEPLVVSKMSMKQMEFSTDFNMYVMWEDGRLNKPEAALYYYIPVVTDMRAMIARGDVVLWTPTMQFANCKGKEASLDSPTFLTRMDLYAWIQRLTMNFTFSLQFSCPYTFTRYPFDEQKCAIQMNYVHGTPIVNWTTAVVVEDMSEIHVPPEYRLVSITMEKCPNVYTVNDNLIECIEYVFVFQRVFYQHIMLLFIPSMLIVFLSWISFWLDETAAPPRVALGLTSLLTLSTQFSNAQKDLPAVADIKAIDIWMFVCMLMVFASLLEFAISNFWYRLQQKSKSAQEPHVPKPPECVIPKVSAPKYVYSVPEKPNFLVDGFFEDSSPQERKQPSNLPKKNYFSGAKGNMIDVCSRFIFPVVFLIFNIVFWIHFTT